MSEWAENRVTKERQGRQGEFKGRRTGGKKPEEKNKKEDEKEGKRLRAKIGDRRTSR